MHGVTDELTTRCLAEVERAMADEPHDERCDCAIVPGCQRDQRLASRLARMLAAGEQAIAGIAWRVTDGPWSPAQWSAKMADEFLRAVAAAREEP